MIPDLIHENKNKFKCVKKKERKENEIFRLIISSSSFPLSNAGSTMSQIVYDNTEFVP